MSASFENTGGDAPRNIMEKSENALPVVNTGAGPVQGEAVNGVNRFLGIPYAQSISGENRFAPPRPVEPWVEVRPAVRFPDLSPQQTGELIGPIPVDPAFETPDYVKPGDDCLGLNIWTPENADGSLPVMVWLHGGGWTNGSGSAFIYDGESLASRGDVVLVSINHRLGASGLADFSRVLGGEFAHSSNLGIRDIIAALEWVRDNIAFFGGNPDLVTIFGESGGGWKVATIMGSRSAKGLFHRAIIQSGPLTKFMDPEQADELAKDFLEELGVTPDTADKLKDISFKDVMEAETRMFGKKPLSMDAPGFPSGFWPVVDNDIIHDHVFYPAAAQCSIDVPLLIGQTGTEFTLFMLADKEAYHLNTEQMEERVVQTFGQDAATKILEIYRRDYPDHDPSGLWFTIFSDFAMGALTSEIMDVRSAPGAAPVYAYRFNWQTPIFDGKLYSPHGIEIPFVFDNVQTEAGIVMVGDARGKDDLAKAASSAWVKFAKTGKPSAEGLPEWPVFTSAGRESMYFDTEIKVGPYMDQSMFKVFRDKLWEQVGLK